MTNNKKPYSLFIGRYQCFHYGHKFIIDSELKLGNRVMIMIRDVEPDDKNPFTSTQVKSMIKMVYKSKIKKGLLKVMIIPDIQSVNYGRGVGYEVKEIIAPKDIQSVSATQIRDQIRTGSQLWKNDVPYELWGVLPEYLMDASISNFVSKLFNWHTKAILKAISYRLLGTAQTVIISLFITNNLSISLSIGGLEVFTKIIIYYIHEWFWRTKK